jgi:hypothetical protein
VWLYYRNNISRLCTKYPRGRTLKRGAEMWNAVQGYRTVDREPRSTEGRGGGGGSTPRGSYRNITLPAIDIEKPGVCRVLPAS